MDDKAEPEAKLLSTSTIIINQTKTALNEMVSTGGYRLVSTYDLPDSRPIGGGGTPE